MQVSRGDVLTVVLAGSAGTITYLMCKLFFLPRPPPMIEVMPIPSRSTLMGRVLTLFGGHLISELQDEAFARHIGWHKLTNGKPFTYRIAHLHIIGVANADDLRYLLVDNYRNYEKNYGYRILEKIIGKGLVSIIDDDDHTVQRREVSPAFSPASLKFIANVTVRTHAATLVKTMKSIAHRPVGDGGNKTVVRELMNRTTMSVITQAAFHSDEGEQTEQLAKDFHDVVENGAGEGRFIPAIDAIFFRKRNQILHQARDRLHRTSRDIAENVRRKNAEQGGATIEDGKGRALIDYIVDSKIFDHQQLLNHCLTFLFAGFETSSNTLQWTLLLLAKAPQIQDQLYEELAAVVGKDTYCEVDDLKSCKFLYNVIKEVLRLYPPAAVLSRSSVKDDVLPSGTFIPGGSFVVPNFFVCHRDPDIWGADSNEFNPYRWDSPNIAAIEERAWMPFSLGKRNCIGKDFAMNEIALLLAAIVRNIKLVWPEDEPIPVRSLQMTMKTKQPFNLLLEEREE